MKVTCNIATFPQREQSLKTMLTSVLSQFDEVRVYFNKYPKVPQWAKDMGVKGTVGQDLTDNGKFFFLHTIEEHEYYFTCDDDLIYPKDYVKRTLSALNDYGGVITHHGRKLRGARKKYYGAHKVYHCLTNQPDTTKLDVCGTGVSAFDTREFYPKGIAFDERRKMTDLLLSLDAVHFGVDITTIPHKGSWIKHIDNPVSIHAECVRNDEHQAAIANEIYRLRYED